MRPYLAEYLRAHRLDTPAFHHLITHYYLPFAHLLAEQAVPGTPLVVGVNGGQGSGKSTLSQVVQLILAHEYHRRTLVLSLDDFYLSKQDRLKLADTVHPLLETRGVPGTHNVALGLEVLEAIQSRQPVAVPVFDKARDDLLHKDAWYQVQQPVDIVLFEGWCVGALPLPGDSLHDNPNALESQHDIDLRWRGFFNQQLAESYQHWFSRLDHLLMLKVPEMAQVIAWRTQQQAHNNGEQIDVPTFVQHYERLTRHMLKTMPSVADLVFHLDSDHGISHVSGKWQASFFSTSA